MPQHHQNISLYDGADRALSVFVNDRGRFTFQDDSDLVAEIFATAVSINVEGRIAHRFYAPKDILWPAIPAHIQTMPDAILLSRDYLKFGADAKKSISTLGDFFANTSPIHGTNVGVIDLRVFEDPADAWQDYYRIFARRIEMPGANLKNSAKRF